MKAFLVSSLMIFVVGVAVPVYAKDIHVAADGSGDFKTIQEAIAALPEKGTEESVLTLAPGRYEGQILIPKNKPHVTFEGAGIDKTVITYGYNINEPNPKETVRKYWGIGVVVLSNDFHAHHLTFENASGDHGQALALRLDGDRAVVDDCHLIGWQDTLRVDDGRAYFTNDYITGRVDFIYGSGTAWFEKCEIHSRNGGFVTAASTPKDHPYGFVFSHCKLTGDSTPYDFATTNPATTQKSMVTPMTDLGRPWRDFACVLFMNCELGGHISPQGWNNWGSEAKEKTARFMEYHNTGPGAATEKRAPWVKQLSDEEGTKLTLQTVMGGTDSWNPTAIAGNEKPSASAP